MEREPKKNITIADVADALGVSKTTVSRSISGKGRIGKETRDRVLEYIKAHHYKPNVIAKGLAQSKTYNLCVVENGNCKVEELSFLHQCLMGIQECAGEKGYDMILTICEKENISSLDRVVSNRKADGVILLNMFETDSAVKYLSSKQIPFVAIENVNEGKFMLGGGEKLEKRVIEKADPKELGKASCRVVLDLIF